MYVEVSFKNRYYQVPWIFYNLLVYVVLLCNCSVLSVVSVKNENYNNNKKSSVDKQIASYSMTSELAVSIFSHTISSYLCL